MTSGHALSARRLHVAPPYEPDPDATVVVVLSRHRAYAEALSIVLGERPEFAAAGVVGAAADVRGAAGRDGGIVVVDADAAGADVAGVVGALHDDLPGGRVVVVASDTRESAVRRLLECGVAGVVCKSSSLEQFLDVLVAVADGQTVIPASALRRRTTRPVGGSLTPRELEVLQLCSRGLGTRQIADRLVISVNTARTHVQAVLTKLNARSRLEAVAMAISSGLVDPPGG